MRLFYLLCALVISTGTGLGQLRFPTTHLDSWGFVAWKDVGTTTKDLETAIAWLNAGKNKEAYASFRAQWTKTPSDYKALHGLVLSAQRTSRLNEVIQMLDERIRKERQPNAYIPPPLVFAMQYAGNMCEYFHSYEKDKAAPRPDHTDRWFYYRFYRGALVPDQLRDPVMIVLYASSLISLSDDAGARTFARAGVNMYPKLHGLKLFLARCYSMGTMSRSMGGKPVPVPPEIQVNIPLWAKLAEEVVRDAPQLALAYYEAGIAHRDVDKAKARRFLTRYLELEKRDTTRIATAKRLLAELSRGP
jgi:hypothetical protein